MLFTLCLGLATAQSGITLNLKDADIGTLIETVAEYTGKNFVIDPRVKAKVTVVSSKPMTQDEVYQVFLSILQVHGYSAVPVGNIIKIVPDVTGKQGPALVTNDSHPGIGDELVTQVIAVQNVPAAQMVPILRPLVPQQGHLAAYAASNVLVISDRAANILRLEKIIQRIDTPEGQQIEIIPIEHASANELVYIVNALIEKDAQGAQLPGKPMLVADERTNSILLGGDKSARLRVRGLIAHLDTPTEENGGSQVVFLNYAVAEDLAPILLGVSQQRQKTGQSKGTGVGTTSRSQSTARPTSTSSSKTRDDIDIQPDPRNNALIITGPPEQVKSIKSIIRQLDIRRAQVLVEAIIAEVNTDLARELGVEFAVAPAENDRGPVVSSNSGNIVSLAAGITSSSSDTLNTSTLANLAAGLFLGAADLRDGATRFAFLLRALARDTANNILSTPTLVTMDNEEAQIVVGQNVPFLTGQFTQSGTDSTNPFSTIERQDVGLTLTLKPQINEGDTIKLQIEQETSSVAPTAQGVQASDIITNKRSIKTNVLVEDDQILVLGGLSQNEFSDSAQKVPVLGDIPILGQLFRNDSTSKTKQNLMVFIHPVIMRNEDTASVYTGQKYSYLRARELESDMNKRGLIKGAVGRLPDLEDLITRGPKGGQKKPAQKDLDAFIDLE
jgi:general secretion pathway protein D